MNVTLVDQDKMNLIGFFLRDLLQNNLEKHRCLKAAQNLRGTFLFNASGMLVSITFQNETVQIASGDAKNASAQIKGEMNDLIDVALGANYLMYLLAGKIYIRGNILKLLQLMKVLRKPKK